MTAHSERRRVPYTPEQMFDLVADVGKYPQFIPWISSARVRKKSNTDNGGEQFEADLVVSFKVFRESYTSLVTTYPVSENAPARINVEAISGPFKKLVTRYEFLPAEGNACDMTFDVEFAFQNRLLQRVAGAAFDLAMRKVAASFEERAKVLYD
jgi:coenzyme Q-binding protein COQ10